MNKNIVYILIGFIMCAGIIVQNCCAPIRSIGSVPRDASSVDKLTQLSNKMMTVIQTTPTKIPQNNGKRLDLFNQIGREIQLRISKPGNGARRTILLKLYAQLYDATIQSVSYLHPSDTIVQCNLQFLDDLATFIDDVAPPCFANKYSTKLKVGERARLLYETALEVVD